VQASLDISISNSPVRHPPRQENWLDRPSRTEGRFRHRDQTAGLRLSIVARGFTSKQANRLIGHKGFKDIKEMWDIFDHQHRTLNAMIGNNEWQHVPRAVEMRNKMVHGQQVFKAKDCDTYAKHVLAALKKLHREVRKD
jgi:hypothetical protein